MADAQPNPGSVEASAGIDLGKNGRDLVYGVGGLLVLIGVPLFFVNPIVGCLGVLVSSPVAALVLWQLHWIRKTGPVILTDWGISVPNLGTRADWGSIASVAARGPWFLDLSMTDGRKITLYVGGGPQVARDLVEERRLPGATSPPVDPSPYRGPSG